MESFERGRRQEEVEKKRAKRKRRRIKKWAWSTIRLPFQQRCVPRMLDPWSSEARKIIPDVHAKRGLSRKRANEDTATREICWFVFLFDRHALGFCNCVVYLGQSEHHPARCSLRLRAADNGDDPKITRVQMHDKTSGGKRSKDQESFGFSTRRLVPLLAFHFSSFALGSSPSTNLQVLPSGVGVARHRVSSRRRAWIEKRRSREREGHN